MSEESMLSESSLTKTTCFDSSLTKTMLLLALSLTKTGTSGFAGEKGGGGEEGRGGEEEEKRGEGKLVGLDPLFSWC